MSTETVPDEVLDRILDYTLAIPTTTFEAWLEQHTFASTPTYAAPIGAILAVSKRWYDIGIPILYESAILRTWSQAEGFAQALANPRLGPLKLSLRVRRLRIESYKNFDQVLQGTPRIADLFLNFNPDSCTDRDQMVQRALREANPSRLFLDRLIWSLGIQKFERTLIYGLARALPEWTRLKQIYASPGTIIWRELLQPLSKAQALEYVCLYGSIATQSISNTPLSHDDGATVLGAISCNPHVKMIHIPKANPHIAVSTLQIRTDGALEKLFIGSGRDMVSMVDYPYDVIKEDPGPLPDLPDKIRERILMQATEECAYSSRRLGREDRLRVLNKPVNRTRKGILLVSKRFYRLGLPCMYGIPHFPQSFPEVELSVTEFMRRICSSSKLADLVRVLYIDSPSELMRVPVPLKNLVYASCYLRVFPALPALLSNGQSSPLQYMEQHLSSAKPIRPTAFLKYSHLQTIILHGGRAGGRGMETSADTLPKLETLHFIDVDHSLIFMFASMMLPSLRKFSYESSRTVHARALSSFLRAHGVKLHTLSATSYANIPQLLNLCPNIVELNLLDKRLPPVDGIWFVEACTSYASMQRIVFPRQFLRANRHYDEKKTDAWYDFSRFLAAHKAQLPALTEVRVDTIVGPHVEYMSPFREFC